MGPKKKKKKRKKGQGAGDDNQWNFVQEDSDQGDVKNGGGR